MKKKSLIWISILIVVAGVAYFILPGTKPKISQKKAEEVAWPIIKECWDGADSRFHTVSLSSSLIFDTGESGGKKIYTWRIGGDYIQDGFPVNKNLIRGNVPEVYVDASTGEISEKHFSEIDAPENPNCR